MKKRRLREDVFDWEVEVRRANGRYVKTIGGLSAYRSKEVVKKVEGDGLRATRKRVVRKMAGAALQAAGVQLETHAQEE